MLDINFSDSSFTIAHNGVALFEHEPSRPCVFIGRGNPSIDSWRGNFFIEDHIEEWAPLFLTNRGEDAQSWELDFAAAEQDIRLTCRLSEESGRLKLIFSSLPAGYNRFMLRIRGEASEHIYGCGEQFSYLDLKGKNFPIWTQEQGVGRNKTTEITKTADRLDRAGGDYYTTFYPQPTYVSSRGYFLHAETSAYADFDFSAPDAVVLRFWDMPKEITLGGNKDSLMETVRDISAFLGRQKPLPGWVYDGIILGVQGGTETCRSKLHAARSAGVPVNGIWAQDWQGEKKTSFGKRLRWNWQWDPCLYPGLDDFIRELREEGLHFLGYINCYLLEDAPLFIEAREQGCLVQNKSGGVLLVDFGEFNAGIVDLTSEKARAWYTGVIRKNMIDFGLSGWMADFGEYLPVEAVLADNSPGLMAHNAWPGLWARVNHEAVRESGKDGELLFFMRAGNAQSLSLCPLLWAGDQNVDWSEDDGLPSALTGALSLAMSGHGLCHSDIGGYTSLYGMKRTKELFLRWAEFAVFTPLMRTHEGNRPWDNWQFDGDRETLESLARLVRIHVALKPYIQAMVRRNADEGIPVMAPVFLYCQKEPFLSCKDHYMFGSDLLAAPVLAEGAVSRIVTLPDGEWIHLFSGQSYQAGIHEAAAPMGFPPVFYRKGSGYTSLFAGITAAFGGHH